MITEINEHPVELDASRVFSLLQNCLDDLGTRLEYLHAILEVWLNLSLAMAKTGLFQAIMNAAGIFLAYKLGANIMARMRIFANEYLPLMQSTNSVEFSGRANDQTNAPEATINSGDTKQRDLRAKIITTPEASYRESQRISDEPTIRLPGSHVEKVALNNEKLCMQNTPTERVGAREDAARELPKRSPRLFRTHDWHTRFHSNSFIKQDNARKWAEVEVNIKARRQPRKNVVFEMRVFNSEEFLASHPAPTQRALRRPDVAAPVASERPRPDIQKGSPAPVLEAPAVLVVEVSPTPVDGASTTPVQVNNEGAHRAAKGGRTSLPSRGTSERVGNVRYVPRRKPASSARFRPAISGRTVHGPKDYAAVLAGDGRETGWGDSTAAAVAPQHAVDAPAVRVVAAPDRGTAVTKAAGGEEVGGDEMEGTESTSNLPSTTGLAPLQQQVTSQDARFGDYGGRETMDFELTNPDIVLEDAGEEESHEVQMTDAPAATIPSVMDTAPAYKGPVSCVPGPSSTRPGDVREAPFHTPAQQAQKLPPTAPYIPTMPAAFIFGQPTRTDRPTFLNPLRPENSAPNPSISLCPTAPTFYSPRPTAPYFVATPSSTQAVYTPRMPAQLAEAPTYNPRMPTNTDAPVKPAGNINTFEAEKPTPAMMLFSSTWGKLSWVEEATDAWRRRASIDKYCSRQAGNFICELQAAIDGFARSALIQSGDAWKDGIGSNMDLLGCYCEFMDAAEKIIAKVEKDTLPVASAQGTSTDEEKAAWAQVWSQKLQNATNGLLKLRHAKAFVQHPILTRTAQNLAKGTWLIQRVFSQYQIMDEDQLFDLLYDNRVQLAEAKEAIAVTQDCIESSFTKSAMCSSKIYGDEAIGRLMEFNEEMKESIKMLRVSREAVNDWQQVREANTLLEILEPLRKGCRKVANTISNFDSKKDEANTSPSEESRKKVKR
jgi:hypothetical protein